MLRLIFEGFHSLTIINNVSDLKLFLLSRINALNTPSFAIRQSIFFRRIWIYLNRMVKLEKTFLGAIAQLVEHLHGMQGVSGSSPLGSIELYS